MQNEDRFGPVGGDNIGINVIGDNNVVGKDITVTNSSSFLRNEELHLEDPTLRDGLRKFNDDLVEILNHKSVSQATITELRDNIRALTKACEQVRPGNASITHEKKTIRDSLARLSKIVLRILPKTAITVAALTHLSPFAELIGDTIQSIIDEVTDQN